MRGFEEKRETLKTKIIGEYSLLLITSENTNRGPASQPLHLLVQPRAHLDPID
jgi:hypothetical protein